MVGFSHRNASVLQVAWEPWVLQLHPELLCFKELVKASGGWVVGWSGRPGSHS